MHVGSGESPSCCRNAGSVDVKPTGHPSDGIWQIPDLVLIAGSETWPDKLKGCYQHQLYHEGRLAVLICNTLGLGDITPWGQALGFLELKKEIVVD